MLTLSRERPTFANGAYLQVHVNIPGHNLYAREYKVVDGEHLEYVEEWECGDCGEYGGDYYDARRFPDSPPYNSDTNQTFFLIMNRRRE